MLSVGTTIASYVVERPLGRGGQAEVWAARHRHLDTVHALKLLHHGQTERLLREGQTQATLDHPNVVPVRDAIQTPFGLVLVMPLVEGPSLQRLLTHASLSPEQAAALVLGIASGLAKAHDRGVVHRDLKPANVLLDPRSGRLVPRITDFGLAKRSDDEGHTRSGILLGTPAYAAPEQLRDAATVDAAADRWSLGVVAYELATGRRPFDEESGIPELLAAAEGSVLQAPTALMRLPAVFDEVILGLLRPDPSQRLALEQVRALLEPHAGELPPAAMGHGIGAHTLLPVGLRASPSVARTTQPTTFDDVMRHNVPRERDAFVGRAHDLRALATASSDGGALVTVVGPPGVGKSRLVTHHLRHGSLTADTAWFCDLTHAEQAADVLTLVAKALELPLSSSDPIAQLGRALAARPRSVVVLDNAEHVRDHVAGLLTQWLDVAAQVQFVVTSRALLGLAGERVVPVGGLSVDDAVELFLLRSRDANPRFSVDDSDQETLEALVALLDHLPLTIELAAARIRIMSPDSLLSRMNDRFRLLGGSRRGVKATLRATLDWSWALLAAEEQQVLAQLSVFEGGFSLEAAEQVVPATESWVPDVVQSLVDQSMVRRSGSDRFELLRSVQAYVAEKLDALGQRVEVEKRHGDHFAQLGTDESLDGLRRSGGVALWRTLAREEGNLSAAGARAVARGDAPVAVPACLAAAAIARRTGPVPRVGELLSSALDLTDLSTRDRARLHLALGIHHSVQGELGGAIRQLQAAVVRFEEATDDVGSGRARMRLALPQSRAGRTEQAEALLQEALAAFRQQGATVDEAAALGSLGNLDASRGALDDAMAHYEASLALNEAAGNRRGQAVNHANIGLLHTRRHDLEQSRQHQELALALHRATGDRVGEASATRNLGVVYTELGRYKQAASLLDAALQAHRRLGDRAAEAVALLQQGHLEGLAGRFARAVPHYQDALALQLALGNRLSARNVHMSLGGVNTILGRPTQAEHHLDAARALQDDIGGRWSEALLVGYRGILEASRDRLGEAEPLLRSAIELHDAVGNQIQRALCLAALGDVHQRSGDLPAALRRYTASVEAVRGTSDVVAHGWLLARSARAHAEAGDPERAQQLFAEASGLLDHPQNPYFLGLLHAYRARAEWLEEDRDQAATSTREARTYLDESEAPPTTELAREVTSLETLLQ